MVLAILISLSSPRFLAAALVTSGVLVTTVGSISPTLRAIPTFFLPSNAELASDAQKRGLSSKFNLEMKIKKKNDLVMVRWRYIYA